MIHIENLTKFYDDVCAVNQINLDIRKGEVLGLLGPNGAGKTTTLRMLTGYIRPTSGSIRILDYDIDKNGIEIKRLMGYLPESAPIYRDMLTYDYLDYVAGIRDIANQDKLPRIRHLADTCGLNEVMHKPIGELSKGFRQRVGLAHAMMNDPEILILDEPTSGLDPNQIIEIRDIIKRIGKEKTVILSTHILSEAEATCDRIVIINRGRIVVDDSTLHLKQSADGECLISIVLKNAEFASVVAELEAVDGVKDVGQAVGGEGALNLKLNCRSSEDLMERIYGKIKQTEWVLLEFRKETRTLENVFRELTMEN